MGQKTKKERPAAKGLTMAPVGVGGEVGRKPGCPDALAITGEAITEPALGQPVGLVAAAGLPQLLVAGQVASIVSGGKNWAKAKTCVEGGEAYAGEVTSVAGRKFQAELKRQ